MNKSTHANWEQWAYVGLVLCIIAFFYFTQPLEVQPSLTLVNDSVKEVKVECSDPMFVDGYWYCDIDNISYTESILKS